MQKYVLVTFLQPITDGAEFTVGHWPLHTTLVPNFAVSLETEQLPGKVARLLSRHQPLQTIAEDDAYFGPEKQTRVTLLRLTAELSDLHHNLVALLKVSGAVFDEPQYLEKGYRPHATVQEDIRLHKGDTIRIEKLSLVDMFPHHDIRGRKVLQTFAIGG